MFHEFIYRLKQKFDLPDRPTEEFCTRCQAYLTMQKGYSNDLPYWICKGCGEVLIKSLLDVTKRGFGEKPCEIIQSNMFFLTIYIESLNVKIYNLIKHAILTNIENVINISIGRL